MPLLLERTVTSRFVSVIYRALQAYERFDHLLASLSSSHGSVSFVSAEAVKNVRREQFSYLLKVEVRMPCKARRDGMMGDSS